MSGAQPLQAFYEALLDDDAEQLYDRAPCGYLSTAPDGMILKVNSTFRTLIGYGSHELVGQRRFVDLLTAGGRIYHETHFAPLLQMQGTAREIALDLVRADGSRLPVLVNAVLERDPEGQPVVVRTAVFDATERRKYERELLHAKQRAEQAEARALALARTLQQTLIPPTPPTIPGLEVAAAYRPAGDGEDVGGDFYDIFQIDDDEWVVGIGDVCGKGAEAAVVTALVRFTLRAAAARLRSPAAALWTVNTALLEHNTDRFCTAALLRLRRQAGAWTATVSAAGHPLPRLIRTHERAPEVGRPGSLLGVLDDPACYDVELALKPGAMLLLYTDGVTEGRHRDEFFGEDRLTASILAGHSSAKALVRGVLEDVLAFQSGSPRDDIAMVAVRVPHDSDG